MNTEYVSAKIAHKNEFAAKMASANQPQSVIDTFLRYYDALCAGHEGYIFEDEIDPVSDNELYHIAELESTQNFSGAETAADTYNLSKTAIIKLNGGLGTSMGLNAAKSLIPVKNDLSFLDITALQIRKLNEKFGTRIPLILMNSFKTEADSLAALRKYPDIFKAEIPPSFIQHKFPKVCADTLAPITHAADPQLEWNPPGHGDLYAAIDSSGVLTTLIAQGYEFAFISNIDNLGATLDPKILNHFASESSPFLMEVTDRTFMDRKGGHIARLKNGGLVLREAAQCPACSLDSFMDTDKHRYFNTNSLWIRLSALKKLIDKNALVLPMICNKKRHEVSEIIQLESAMGSALSVFENSNALRVPRTRFAPVKNCEELLLLWSDYYYLTGDFRIVMNPKHKSIQMDVKLDPHFYKSLDQLKARFPHGAPSLAECESLSVIGDVRFGKDVVIKGNTAIVNNHNVQLVVDDNAVLSGSVVL